MIELLFKVRRLFNVIIDLELQVNRNEGLIRQFLEYFKLLAAFDVLRSYVGDDFSNAVDVVGHDYAAEGFDEDQTDGFRTVRGYDVTETYC